MRPRTASFLAIGVAVLLTVLITALGSSMAGIPPLGVLLDPLDGLYRTARSAERVPDGRSIEIPGLTAVVKIDFDARGVPHIYGDDDLDVVRAYGFVVARDRLFQMDFISRVAAGRLSTLVGADAVEADRFLRRTGMEIGTQLNAQRIQAEDAEELAFIQAYCDGVNAFVDSLTPVDYPLEYRLLGAQPERCTLETPLRIAQYMTYDLSYQSDDALYGTMRDRLSEEEYTDLFGTPIDLYVPIIPSSPTHGEVIPSSDLESGAVNGNAVHSNAIERNVIRGEVRNRWLELHRVFAGTTYEGFVHGKGSNNWTVSGSRSTTGAPILAGDMHLSLSLPAIWYEARLKGPTIDVYGVGVPGSPLPIQSFTPDLGWAFTNTGSDQIDHYRLTLSPDRKQYLHDGEWRSLEMTIDTIRVKGGRAVLDTLYLSHWGPVLMDDEAIATRWTAHSENRVLNAVIGMSRATNVEEFDAALRYWDAPMQNILYADRKGTIAIRSTGRYPLRERGDGAGVLDGSTFEGDWVGYVSFDELPYAVNPSSGYLTSTNQNPVDSTYPHYLGHDWRPGYRSVRIDALLNGKERHSPDEIASYQADTYVVQFELFFPFLDTLQGVDAEAEALIEMLRRWDGFAHLDRPEPLVFQYFFEDLAMLTWDEEAFVGGRKPSEGVLHRLLRDKPDSIWFNRESTDETENAADILRLAIESANRRIHAEHGDVSDQWLWGDFNQVMFRHITSSDALRTLWRGAFPFGGFDETLSPARGTPVIHSASWRVVLDFSTSPLTARGIYPGGQSGDPFSRLYDAHIEDYLDFRYYSLEMAPRPEEHSQVKSMVRLTLTPRIND
jgi:penicillin G amidase